MFVKLDDVIDILNKFEYHATNEFLAYIEKQPESIKNKVSRCQITKHTAPDRFNCYGSVGLEFVQNRLICKMDVDVRIETTPSVGIIVLYSTNKYVDVHEAAEQAQKVLTFTNTLTHLLSDDTHEYNIHVIASRKLPDVSVMSRIRGDVWSADPIDGRLLDSIREAAKIYL